MFSLAGALTSIPYVAAAVSAVVAAGLLWNSLIENPTIRAEARAGMVAVAELSAAKAELAETKRQAAVAKDATDNFAEVVRRQAQDISVKLTEQEKRYAEYEKRLEAMGRQCLLDDDDVRELSR